MTKAKYPWRYYDCVKCGKKMQVYGPNPKPMKDCVCGSKLLLVEGREGKIATKEGIEWNSLETRRMLAEWSYEKVPEDDTQLGE